MKLYVIRDSNFTLNAGRPASNLLHYDAYARRYLQVFDEVVLVGRLFHKEDRSAKPVTGERVSFHAFPAYQGPLGFLRALPAIVRAMTGAIERDAAYVLRVPATIPGLYALVLWARRIPFAVEVAADPYDGYGATALAGARLARLWRWLFVTATRWQCRRAAASAYVTAHALQRRYPPGNPRATFAFTSLDLDDDCFAPSPSPVAAIAAPGPLHVVMVGNMQKSLKGHDVLLQALARLRERGFDLRTTLIGFGESQPKFEALAAELGLADRVAFTGKLPAGGPIRDILDTADLFVLPSRQEGLPRALLEAMARGLPAVASDVGGTSELLPAHALVRADDVDGLAEAMARFLSDPALRAREAARNLEVARGYHIRRVNAARLAFFHAIREASGDRRGREAAA